MKRRWKVSERQCVSLRVDEPCRPRHVRNLGFIQRVGLLGLCEPVAMESGGSVRCYGNGVLHPGRDSANLSISSAGMGVSTQIRAARQLMSISRA